MFAYFLYLNGPIRLHTIVNALFFTLAQSVSSYKSVSSIFSINNFDEKNGMDSDSLKNSCKEVAASALSFCRPIRTHTNEERTGTVTSIVSCLLHMHSHFTHTFIMVDIS